METGVPVTELSEDCAGRVTVRLYCVVNESVQTDPCFDVNESVSYRIVTLVAPIV